MTTTRPGGVDDRSGRRRDARRRGAHRARPSWIVMIVPSIVVLAVIGMVGAMIWALVGNGFPTGSDASTAGRLDGAEQSTSSPATTGGSATSSAQPTPADTGTVDRTIRLRVLNNTSTMGLAARASQALVDNGWKVSEVGNAIPRGTLTNTTVYYAQDLQIASATAVADELGARIAKDAKVAEIGLTVVLAPDYKP